jgi:ubiquinone/menaquinone biosynthesis C-methylase UbiE
VDHSGDKPFQRTFDPVSQPRLQEIYSRTAAFYDEVVAAHQARAKDVAMALLARRPGERFLEAGCGTGWCFTRIVAAMGADGAVGLDVAPGMLDVARQALTASGLATGGLVLGDATRLPFPGATFDCLLCTYTLDVLPSPLIDAALRDMRRVLRPEGRIVVAALTFGEGDDAAFTDDWQQRYERDPEYFGGARPLRLSPLVEAAGFALQERRYSGHGDSWPTEVVLATP